MLETSFLSIEVSLGMLEIKLYIYIKKIIFKESGGAMQAKIKWQILSIKALFSKKKTAKKKEKKVVDLFNKLDSSRADLLYCTL